MLSTAHPRRIRLLAAAAVATLLVACSEPQRTTSPSERTVSKMVPQHTEDSGFGGTPLGRGTIAEGFKINRKNDKWQLDINAKDPLDVSVFTLTVQPGGHSGWHSHPGPVFVVVVSGTLTFYDSSDPSCTPVVRTAGQVFWEAGDHPHITRNETGQPATFISTVFSPVGAALRIDEPASGNCPF